jgi:competence protein ComEC
MNERVRCWSDNLLICVTLCFIAGASAAFAWAGGVPQQPIILGILLLLAVLAVIAWRLPRHHAPLTALPFFFLVGLLHTTLALQASNDPHHVSRMITARTTVTLTGRILTMPEFDGEKTRFEVATQSLLIHDQKQPSPFQPVRGTVQLTVAERLAPQLGPGTDIMALATVDRIRTYQTPGAFDYRLQMAAKSIHCSGWIPSAAAILPVHDSAPAWWSNLRLFPERIRQRIAQTLEHRFEGDLAGLYQALLVGSLVNVSPQTLEIFKENGTFHILSISGLHFSLLGLFAAALFTWLLKRSQWLLLHTHVPTVALALTAPLLLFYTFIAGMNVPAIRAMVTALLVLFAVVLRRQRSLLPLIAAAALLILALSPLSLFTASFQLSFAAVLAINLIYPRLPILAVPPESPDAWRRYLSMGIRTVQSLLYVSLAATAGTLPILLYHFNRFSLIGPVMNLLIEPLLCLWALPFGLLAIPLIWIVPDLAHLLLDIGSLGIRLTLWLADLMRGFPYASIWTITPSWLEIGLYLLVLWLLLHRRLTVARTILAGSLATLLLGSFTRSLWYPSATGELAVHFLDVGQGSSVLVQLPHGKNMLIDGGGYQTERFDAGQSLIAPFLWRQRIWRLDDLLISHPHSDHYNGLPFVIDRFRPQRLIVNGAPGEEPAYSHLLNRARRTPIPIQEASADDLLRKEDDLTLLCLGMPGLPEDTGTINDRSLVLHLQYGRRSFLLPADIGLASEQRLLQSGADLRADVLLAPHHGSQTSAGEEFLAAVHPSLIVVSAGQQRHDSRSLTSRLNGWQQKNILPLITARDGTISCRSDGNTLSVKTFTGKDWVFDATTGRFTRTRRDLKGRE